ncbi:hypothetical protein [Moraxella nasicaprae]|uniref:Uncharacterized protein n=1 Tax=Moraxella nasicaprae TaxID=2904122 RepID=A0ABY6F2X6_9GAMM|nr:hypothetical protein [Moraxella nasicaprae]UXZ04450.1 hypothetical protein LU297_07605 [Moraxella nasicaprae]
MGVALPFGDGMLGHRSGDDWLIPTAKSMILTICDCVWHGACHFFASKCIV